MDDRLFNLLPAVHRRHDAETGSPLRALLAVLESELLALEAATKAQYENSFIETCDESVVTAIGELVGVSAPADGTVPASHPRALVANAIHQRRRKGTPATLADVARDVSGRPVRVVEYYPLLAASQHVGFPRPGRGGTVDLRDPAALGQHGGPFATLAARPDVRNIAGDRGRHNINNVGVFVWRGELLTAGPMPATPVADHPGAFTFHPLGIDQQLAVRPGASAASPGTAPGEPASGFAGGLDLPEPISPAALSRYPAALIGPGLSIDMVIAGRSIGPAAVLAADLRNWALPRSVPPSVIALDLRLGRLLCADPSITDVQVSYAYRAAGRVGGGSYDRRAGLERPAAGGRDIAVRGVGAGRTDALAVALNGNHQTGDVVTIDDDAVCADDVVIAVPPGATLVVRAADGCRPTIRGALRVQAPGGGSVTLDGLLVAGPITLTGSISLTLRHAGVPGGVRSTAGDSTLQVGNCLLGPVDLGPSGTITAVDSVIDGAASGGAASGGAASGGAASGGAASGGAASGGAASDGVANRGVPADPARPAVTGRSVELTRVTVLGALRAEHLTAADSILDGPVTVDRRQSGGLRYCYLPVESATPARFRCQPDLALVAAGAPGDVIGRIRPRYRDRTFGAAGYADLAAGCPAEIAAGAESGSEMGAFAGRLRPQRDAALRAAIQEYLPAGLMAGVIDVL